MSRVDLDELTVAQLKALAAELGVTPSPRATKAELVKALVAARGAQAARAGRGPARSTSAKAPARPTAKQAPTKAPTKVPTKVSTKAPTKAPMQPPARKAVAARPTASPAPAPSPSPAPSRPLPFQSVERPAKEGPSAVALAVAAGLEVAPPIIAWHEPVLPGDRGADRLVAMARDPRCLFTYWELGDRHLRAAMTDAGAEARLCLRVYEVRGGHGLARFLDQIISDRIGREYLLLDAPGRTFVAEVGAEGADDVFIPIARSAVVTMPRESVSELIDRGFRPEGPVELTRTGGATAASLAAGGSSHVGVATSPGGSSLGGSSRPG